MHPLSEKWVLWAHLPHDNDWSIQSYISIMTVTYVEEILALMHTLPDSLLSTCMFFCMKEHIKPVWEDPANKQGGCFSYKVINKNVYDVWREFTYALVGNTISTNDSFVANVNGITISPKKNFCIVKIWMSNCSFQNPDIITNEVTGLDSHGCLFKKHTPEY